MRLIDADRITDDSIRLYLGERYVSCLEDVKDLIDDQPTVNNYGKKPMKVNNQKMLYDFNGDEFSVCGDCPCCGQENLMSINHAFCPNCGLALDWSE